MVTEDQKALLKRFGNHVCAIRKNKKLSYRMIADNCNIDFTDISKIEKGKRNVTFLTVVELAKGLGVPLPDVVTF